MQLLLKILETSEISANVAKISETWPDTEEAPTPRAIQERLVKIRAMAGGKGLGSFKVSGTVGSRGGAAKTSPAKASTPKKSAAKAATGSPNKRKRSSGDDDEPNTPENGTKPETHASEPETESPSKRSKSKAADRIKAEPGLSMDGAFDAYFSMPGEI
ncbi:MAG: hypothetical protein LQ337_007941 [Flavoplaca oasis]|nr:MAG: hypothetical protein LQ337_007941 [Flavoplaca oasis]